MEAPSSTPSAAPATSAPPASSPAPSSSQPTTPTSPSGINRSTASSIFAELDAAESGTGEASQQQAAPAAIPVAKVPDTEAQAEAQPQQQVAAEGEDLPLNIREALKALPDPKLRKQLADGAYILRDLSRNGTPVAAVRQFINDAPKYLSIAPTVDVLEDLATRAETASTLGDGFLEGSPEGYQRMTGALLQANPGSWVNYAGWMMRNIDQLTQGLGQHFGGEVATALAQHRDALVDQSVKNGIARMRDRAEQAKKSGNEDDEVWSEVADYVEKFFDLGPKEAKQTGPRKPDPRDLRIQQLESEKNQQLATQREQFADGIFNEAGHALDQSLKAYLSEKCKGWPQEAYDEVYQRIGTALYEELLNNPHIKRRGRAIEQQGRYDRGHFQKLTSFYIENGKKLLENVAAPVIGKFARITAPAVAARQQRVAAQVNRRDPGSAAGAPPGAAQPRLKPGMSPKDIFATLDLEAEG